MFGKFFDLTARFAGELFLQIVPPAALAAYAASELAQSTEITFVQAAAMISAGLLICLMVNALRE